MSPVNTQKINSPQVVDDIPSIKPKRSSLYRAILLKLISKMDLGYMKITLPEGAVLEYGSPEAELKASMLIRRESFFKRCVLHGDVGFGEAYMDRDWDTEDPTKVIEWMILNIENHPTLMDQKSKWSPLILFKFLDNIKHYFRENTIKGSKKNIEEHYDLGNDFFKLFLDPSMTYSSAYFDRSEATLEEAQTAKYRNLCEKLQLKEEDHVLEIGCGWGGFSEYAAKNYGCKITAVTISLQQYIHARERFCAAGVDHLIDLQIQDYRKIEGKFDKIASIEMIEAVGHKYLPVFFKQCHHLLQKKGLLGMQMILAPDHRYESFRKRSDWIQKHIFPGGLLPSFEAILQAIRKTGDLGVFHYEDMSPHYAETLARWCKTFDERKEQVLWLGFDEEFFRKWIYYFSYCEAAFSMRNISVVQAVFSRPNNHSL